MKTQPVYTYGPVPSRRLGRSLGVSPIPSKTCSYSCVYCQLGRTDHLTVRRESFFDREAVLAEIKEQTATNEIDYITFAGDGEPTLSLDLGWLIHEIREATGIPVAVITNGSLLGREDVRNDLLEADVILPSLDAGSTALFRKINRPHGSLKFDDIVKGMIDFSREYKGLIWLEVMLIEGRNDTDSSLKDISDIAEQFAPDRIYLTTPIRPPAEPWVKIPAPRAIIKAEGIIGSSISVAGNEEGAIGLDSFDQAEDAILEIGSRHPLRLEQALQIEKRFNRRGIVDSMIAERTLLKVHYNSNTYLLPGKFVRGG